MGDEKPVLRTAWGAGSFGALLLWECFVSGPHTTTVVLLVLCILVVVFCMVLLGMLAAERRSAGSWEAPLWKDDR